MLKDHYRSSLVEGAYVCTKKNYPLLKMVLGVFLVSMLGGSCVSGKGASRESPSPLQIPNSVKIHVWQGNNTNQGQKIQIFIEQILNKKGFKLSDYKTADIIVALRDVTDDEPPSHTASFQKKTVVDVQIMFNVSLNKDLFPDIKGVESKIIEIIREEIVKETKLTNINTPLADNFFLYLDLF